MKHLKSFIFTIIALMIGTASINAKTAKSVLSDAANKYKQCQSLTADFTMTVNGNSSKGTITIAKDKFALSSPQLAIWYDGRTQWTYSPDTQEVNITEPTSEELQQVNPFAIVSAFSQSYKSKLLKSSAGTNKIQLDPINKNESIKQIILVLDDKTSYPKEINIKLNTNNIVKIVVSNVKAGGKVNNAQFIFDKKKYPNAELIDLR